MRIGSSALIRAPLIHFPLATSRLAARHVSYTGTTLLKFHLSRIDTRARREPFVCQSQVPLFAQ